MLECHPQDQKMVTVCLQVPSSSHTLSSPALCFTICPCLKPLLTSQAMNFLPRPAILERSDALRLFHQTSSFPCSPFLTSLISHSLHVPVKILFSLSFHSSCYIAVLSFCFWTSVTRSWTRTCLPPCILSIYPLPVHLPACLPTCICRKLIYNKTLHCFSLPVWLHLNPLLPALPTHTCGAI